MNVGGEWPRPVTLRSGWARAIARPWNDDVDDAHLRLIRGSATFLAGCVEALGGLGAAGVASTPLLPANRGIWERAGFVDHLELKLYRRPLDAAIEKPAAAVAVLEDVPWERLVTIDASAFEPLWRMSEAALQEAFDATTRATVLATDPGPDPSGFAIVGVAGGTAYLQRIAVDPTRQGEGLGRSLVRAALGWGMRRGAAAMILNTQPDNAASAALYEAEGFAEVAPGLVVLRKVT